MEGVYSNLNKIDSKVDKNKQRIDEMHRREESLREEVDAWRDRPCNTNHIINTDNRDTINFRNYKRNPIEFLKRVEELIVKNRETRWTTVRGMLDEMFRETYDNWWTATRPDIQSIQEFKTQFKAKYWSESTQNMVRNNLSNGRYESQNGQSLSLIHI